MLNILRHSSKKAELVEVNLLKTLLHLMLQNDACHLLRANIKTEKDI